MKFQRLGIIFLVLSASLSFAAAPTKAKKNPRASKAKVTKATSQIKSKKTAQPENRKTLDIPKPALAATPEAASTTTPASPPVAPAASEVGPPPVVAGPKPVAPPAPTEVPFFPAGTSFLDSYPHLKKFVYEEPHSGFYVGFGFSPIGLLRDKFMFTGSFFQLHWIKDRYDIELFNASFAMTRGQSADYQSNHFTFRMAPKYRFFGIMSAGPLLGYEFVSFPGTSARIFRAPYIEPNSEPFSSRGWIYGLAVSQTFEYKQGYLVKCDELFYNETYSTRSTINGWDYRFNNPAVERDPSKVGPGFVLMFAASLLY